MVADRSYHPTGLVASHLKGYLPHQWSITQAKFFHDQGLDGRYYTGAPWTSQLITYFWTQSHTLWKGRYASAHAPATDNLDKSIARTRQTAQYSVKMADTHGPIIVALDRRIFDVPLEEHLQSRTSDLVAWTTTILPVICHSISEARKQLRTGHQDICTYFSTW
jgi:hypothetical protein